jgi:hypothetical protein
MADQVWSGSPAARRTAGHQDHRDRGDAATPEDTACLTRAQPQPMFRLFFRDGRRLIRSPSAPPI